MTAPVCRAGRETRVGGAGDPQGPGRAKEGVNAGKIRVPCGNPAACRARGGAARRGPVRAGDARGVGEMPRSSVALNRLRACAVLSLLAFHSVMAYLGSLPATPYLFDAPPYRWAVHPMIDAQRWFGFD